MRIALNGRFLAAVPTGVQRFAFEIARRVLAQADAVLMVPRGVAVPPALSDLAPVRSGRFRGNVWEQLELAGMARRAGCDVTLNLANALPLVGGPHVVVLHDATVFEHPEWFALPYRLWHRRVLLPAARRAAAVGTLSGASARALGPLLRRPREEIAVLDQGAAPLEAPATPDAVADARKRLGLQGPYLLASGASDPRKNMKFLVYVLTRWPAVGGGEGEGEAEGEGGGGGERPPILVVVGEGSWRVFSRKGVGGLEDAAKGWPARGDGTPEGGGFAGAPTASRQGDGGSPAAVGVYIAGRVDDETLRALYTGAAAFCFPSLAEGFGRPPLEALACGTPVVVAPYGPAREVLGDAALVLPLEVEAWLGALRQLVREGPPPGFAERARAVVRAHRWEDGAEAAIELCARAAGQGGDAVPRRPAASGPRDRRPGRDSAAASPAAEAGRDVEEAP